MSEEQMQMEETFRRLGLSEEGARRAARGRDGLFLLREPKRSDSKSEPMPKGKRKKLGRVFEALGLSEAAAEIASEDLEEEAPKESEMGLEEAFLRMGLPPGQAKVAAEGRR